MSIAVIGADATIHAQGTIKIANSARTNTNNDMLVTENHGGFLDDPTMIVSTPLGDIANRSASDGISIIYSKGYLGTYNLT